jgi:hypothetical protein
MRRQGAHGKCGADLAAAFLQRTAINRATNRLGLAAFRASTPSPLQLGPLQRLLVARPVILPHHTITISAQNRAATSHKLLPTRAPLRQISATGQPAAPELRIKPSLPGMSSRHAALH